MHDWQIRLFKQQKRTIDRKAGNRSALARQYESSNTLPQMRQQNLNDARNNVMFRLQEPALQCTKLTKQWREVKDKH